MDISTAPLVDLILPKPSPPVLNIDKSPLSIDTLLADPNSLYSLYAYYTLGESSDPFLVDTFIVAGSGTLPIFPIRVFILLPWLSFVMFIDIIPCLPVSSTK